MSIPASSVIRSLIPDLDTISSSRFARLANLKLEEELKTYESGRELSLIIRQSQDAVDLGENNKHVGEKATELAKG